MIAVLAAGVVVATNEAQRLCQQPEEELSTLIVDLKQKMLERKHYFAKTRSST